MKKREAVILAPVMPVWDEGQFCAPLVTLLVAKGYHVTVIDTLTLIQDGSPERAVEALSQALNARFQSSYLLVGFAMAGTLVQLLAPHLHGLSGVMSVSAPGFADEQLNRRLGELVSLLEEGEVEHAVDVLHQFVVPEGQAAPEVRFTLPDAAKASAIQRMLTGFALLLNMDARAAIARYNGKYLAIVGDKSQLASWENQTHSTQPTHLYRRIPEAGMRPWNDNPAAMNALLNEWVDTL
ncbi:hypothetical protein [Pseudocitrobacter corydidari]|uniref:Alpha/beta hydrolase n=1 Tax=Pseudocitrobacter corydidari TaxID=2891570 RepID=A0ABY3S245_9ENTR|nr:hypothetical protein [Pseudocitrobacter corydidari]UGS39959.1 hypothetical protein G163CM_06440 [Pseudocitrobacter corydidari]